MKEIKVQIPDEVKIETIISENDVFYGHIHIAEDHIKAWAKEFETLDLKEISLIEEMAELTQAISKAYRDGYKKPYSESVNPIKEEMAHVLISLRGLADAIGIQPESIQAEIEKKWPSAYEPKSGKSKDCYWSMKTQHDHGITTLCCSARCNLECSAIGPCGGFAKKEEK